MGRGITDAGLFANHGVGFCDNTLNDILPSDGDIRETLRQTGILLGDGTERFKDCVVFPIHDPEGNIVTLYGRHISGKKHLFLPGRPTGLWNSNVIRTCPDIILTESVIDALSVRMAGFANVVSVGGVNGLTAQEITDMRACGVLRIILLMDGDEPGIRGSERLKERLTDFSVETRILPDNHDPNSYLQAYGAPKLAEFIQTSNPEPSENTSRETPEFRGHLT